MADPAGQFPSVAEGDGPRFVPSDAGFLQRNHLGDALLGHWTIIAGTGSWLEAHLMARLSLARALPTLRGCGVTEQEVCQLVQTCDADRPLLILLSESIATDRGRHLINELRQQRPDGQILLLVQQDGWLSEQALRSCKAQAIVHVESFGSGTMIRALQALQRGETFVDGRLKQQRAQQAHDQLTSRESQTLEGLARGSSNRDIAEALGIAPATVRDYVSSLCRKLAAANRTEVVVRAIALGLIPV